MRLAAVVLIVCFPILVQAQDELFQTLDDLYNAGDYQACLNLEPQLKPILSQRRDTTAANAWYFLGDSYHQLGKTKKAVEYLERETEIRKQLANVDPTGYSGSLYTLTQLYLETGDSKKALTLAKVTVDFDRNGHGKNSVSAVYSTLLLVDILIAEDQLKLAESELQKSLKNAPESLRGQLLGKLGYLQGFQGKYSQASRNFVEALDQIKSHSGVDTEDYQFTLANYGYLHLLQGKFDLAEEELGNSVEKMTDEGFIGPEFPFYYAMLNNLALTNQALGQFSEAKKAYLNILSNDSATIGTDHSNYAITLSNLGLLYIDEKRFSDAERTLQKSLEILRRSGGTKTISYAITLNNLAKVYTTSKAPQKAIPILTEALAVFGKQLGKKTPEYATALFNLGVAHLEIRSEKSIGYLKQATALRKQLLGVEHPRYAESLEKLAIYHWQKKDRKSAADHFHELFNNYYAQVENYFPVLTEEEKSDFFYNRIRPSNETFTTWAIENGQLGELYDIQLNTKGIILFATDKLRKQIHQSGDSSLIDLFDQWEAQKEQLAFHYGQNHLSKTVDSLQRSSQALEKVLSRKSAAFTKEIIRPKFTWRDVQKALKPGAAAMEIIRYRVFEKDSARLGNKTRYGALILSDKTPNGPEFVSIENGDQLEARYLRYYRNGIQFRVEDTYSYPALWEAIHNKLNSLSVTTVHVAADGIYHQIALNTLFNPTTEKFLIEELIIHNVNSTRDLVDGNTSKLPGQGYYLFGFPSFSVEHDSTTATSSSRNLVSVSRSIRGSLNRFMKGGIGISSLPGTQSEISEINTLLKSQDAHVYTAREANENTVKKVKSPKVLHIATHGFFFDDYLQSGVRPPNPLLNSGLILAGASNFILNGYNPVHVDEDGILTAYEAMNLDLEGTEVVILSACETGLGEQRNGEGVYGLQRAFGLAGADGVVMSLWSVDDQATRDLMTLFYRKWIATSDISASFREAQLEVMKKYKEPYYWGAFVVVE